MTVVAPAAESTASIGAGISPMAQRIAMKRADLKLTVKAVADCLGLSVQSIYFYEKGEREPTGENLFALADLLGVRDGSFLGLRMGRQSQFQCRQGSIQLLRKAWPV